MRSQVAPIDSDFASIKTRPQMALIRKSCYQHSWEQAHNITSFSFYGKAVLGLIQAFAFNMIYFEIDSTNIFTHAIRRHYVSCKFRVTCPAT